MEKETLVKNINEFIENSEYNYIKEEARNPAYIGQRLFEEPIIKIVDSTDPGFEEQQKPEVVGPHFKLPTDWLPGAKRVISLFYPFSEEIYKSNREGPLPSDLWIHGYSQGQRFILLIGEKVVQLLEESGYKAICPYREEDYRYIYGEDLAPDDSWQGFHFTSNWSERHVGYVAGVGTFGLSKGMITEKGMAGRMVSIITDWEGEVDEREEKGLEDNCIKCGACANKCPAGAISIFGGKDHWKCWEYLKEVGQQNGGFECCGKCQSGVTCEHVNPSGAGGIGRAMRGRRLK